MNKIENLHRIYKNCQNGISPTDEDVLAIEHFVQILKDTDLRGRSNNIIRVYSFLGEEISARDWQRRSVYGIISGNFSIQEKDIPDIGIDIINAQRKSLFRVIKKPEIVKIDTGF